MGILYRSKHEKAEAWAEAWGFTITWTLLLCIAVYAAQLLRGAGIL